MSIKERILLAIKRGNLDDKFAVRIKNYRLYLKYLNSQPLLVTKLTRLGLTLDYFKSYNYQNTFQTYFVFKAML